MDQKNKLGEMPIPQLLLNMSLPLMLSLLIQSLYNIVDSIFVARVSEQALTATSLAFPLQLLMIAAAVGTSVGVNAQLSRSVGAGETAMTADTASTGVILAALEALFFVALGVFFSGAFSRAFTEDAVIGAYCQDYLRVCMVFGGGTFLATMYQRFLQSVGKAFESMISLIAGALTNLLLDPILIFGLFGFPALQVLGAAIATVIGQWVSAAVAIWLNHRKNPQVQPARTGFRLQSAIVLRIYQVGLPTILTQAMGCLMVTTINAILMPVSSTAVAFFGAYYKLQSFLFMPMNGLGQAAIPIVGYNYGAKQPQRVRQLFRTILPVAGGVALVATLLFSLFPNQILSLFHPSEEMLSIGVPALRIISLTFPLAALTSVQGYSVSGLGVGYINMVATTIRQFIPLAPILFLLVRSLGVQAAWYAFWPAEVLALVFASVSVRRVLSKKLAVF